MSEKKIDQKSYLQKYLTGKSADKKKKKKKVTKGKGFKIIDDDIDLSKLRSLDGDELDVFAEGEDAPQIAGVIDDRPEELKRLDELKNSTKWRVISQDDGFNSKLHVEEIKRDVKEVKKENEIMFGKMYSDSEDENKNDSDASPPRKQNNKNNTDVSPSKKQNSSKSSSSAHLSKKPQNNSDSDFSPPRKNNNTQNKESRKNYDTDVSPRRKNQTQKKERSKPSRWGHFEEPSNSNLPKQSRKDTRDSDASPPRKSSNYNEDQTRQNISRERRKSPDSDISPLRKRNHSVERSYKNDKRSRNKHSRIQSSDSDLSPPRKGDGRRLHDDRRQQQDDRRANDDRYDNKYRDNDRRYNTDNRERRDRDNRDRQSNSPPPTHRKMERTLEGKMAGLQDARQLKEENEAFRTREEEAFRGMTDDVSGRNAKVVSRRSKRETSEERHKLKEKQEKQKELDDKYKKWSKGLKQIQDQQARQADFAHEAAKPLARYKDDRDLERSLRDVERQGDPMLKYIREKKRERGELPPERPQYKGSFPPNRFNIRPGYRWDGVDRSNGYEKKYFDQQSKRRAQAEEAYKWSTEDL